MQQIQYNAFVGREHFLLFVPVASNDKSFLSKTISSHPTFAEAVTAYNRFKQELVELGNGYKLDGGAQYEWSRYAEILNSDKKSIFSLSVSKEHSVYKLFLEVFKP